MTIEPSRGEPAERDDHDLLRAIGRGDRSALVTLYERHARVVLSHLVLLTADHGFSEEILQDTMLAVWRGAGRFRGEASVRSWIIAIARRQCRDRQRRKRPATVGQEVLADRPSLEPGPEQRALDRMSAGTVMEAIKGLTPQHREILGLVFGGGLSLGETAQVLEIPVGTVKSRLSAARAALVRSMPEKGYAS
ncbi:RNA polymerase sigma factor [Thermomonospora umbrina]|uniref:RNA polymerase sigma factor n=1 Tax=Thermomonospora umbrina TaxID=111806 RepID=A0A3D9SNC9_9ACTN|nr:sigma-70 family RNA polymerase sigma factor [Thermomonospora umbrina]REE97429.1 RNA polymerase sigma-70 factor (ECF subfamily) [Thermomonospora umbrina]